jgi:hypothetical protein
MDYTQLKEILNKNDVNGGKITVSLNFKSGAICNKVQLEKNCPEIGGFTCRFVGIDSAISPNFVCFEAETVEFVTSVKDIT